MRIGLAALYAFSLTACAGGATTHVKRDVCNHAPYRVKMTTRGKAGEKPELELVGERAAIKAIRD